MKLPVGIRGKFAEVDEEDYPAVAQFKWIELRVCDLEYAYRLVRVGGKWKQILLHREILGAKQGQRVDHRDGNGLNNRRENLRFCSHAENMRNRRISRSNKSGFKGVYFGGRSKATPTPWRAEIKRDGKKYCLGYFKTPEEAHAAYMVAAVRLHGEFANAGGCR